MANPNFNCVEYNQGRTAYVNGYERDLNPYPKTDERYDLWNQGFDWEKSIDETGEKKEEPLRAI